MSQQRQPVSVVLELGSDKFYGSDLASARPQSCSKVLKKFAAIRTGSKTEKLEK